MPLRWECPGPAWQRPAPGLLLQAARDLNIDLASSWMLGDKQSDIQAGLAAGCHAGLIGTRQDVQTPDIRIWRNLLEAAKEITGGIICRNSE